MAAGSTGSYARPRTGKTPFPDFLIIGAQKAGTSWLAANLSRHPDVWTPPLKELHYFDERIKESPFGASLARLCLKGYTDEDWYPWYWRYQARLFLEGFSRSFGKGLDPRTLAWALRFFLLPPSDRWYASLFEQGRDMTTGEATPEYAILEERSIAHVRELIPNARIIFSMRNRIERLYSSALMRLRNLKMMGRRVEADERFFEGFFREPEVVAETKYLQNLEAWRRFYPDEQIFVGFLEDIHFRPDRLLRRLHEFLRVDPSRAQRVERTKINAASYETMPAHLAVRLARAYHEDLRRLSAHFGGYADFWLYCAERLIGDPPEGEIPCPLWGSWLWEEWQKQHRPAAPAATRDREVQSRTLAPF